MAFQKLSAFLSRHFPLVSGKSVLLTGRYAEVNILPLQFSEYYDFISLKSPNISKNGILVKN